MNKLVLLTFGDGNFEQGFPVTLQLGEDGALPSKQVTGKLPPCPEIPELYSNWQSSYRHMMSCFRLEAKPGSVVSTSSSKIREAAQVLSNSLNTWLNSEQFRSIKEQLLLIKLGPDDKIRAIVQAEDLWLQKMPWHLWDLFEHYPRTEVALSSTEYARVDKHAHAMPRNKVNILAIIGDSTGIDIQKDRALLEQLPEAEIKFIVEGERRELHDQLWDQPCDILFFAGHSRTEKETGIIYINETDSLTITDLKYALKRSIEQGLQLAIFNSCDGLRLAKQLADLHMRQIVVMREPVPDYVAQEFLKYFLKAFANGQSLYTAVREARERLQGIENQFPCASWLPVIYQNLAEAPMTWEELLNRSPVSPVENGQNLVNWSKFQSQTLPSSGSENTEVEWSLVLSGTVKEVDKARAEAIVTHLRKVLGDIEVTLEIEVEWSLVLSGTVKEVDKARAEAIVAHLRRVLGDIEVTLERIEEGSVRLVFKSHRKAFEQTEYLVKSGQLTELSGFLVLDVLLDDKMDISLRVCSAAVREARKRLQGLENEFPCASWLPVICQNPAEAPLTWEQLLNRSPVSPVENGQNLVNWSKLLTFTGKTFTRNFGWIVLLLGLGLVGWRFVLPKLAIAANNRAFDNYSAGQLSQAQEALQLATTLNPKIQASYYIQGRLCEDVRDFDCAREKYQVSAKLGLDAAYSELARLYIIQEDYSAAVDLAGKGLDRSKDNKDNKDNRVKYALHKNMGWARLEQGRYREASVHLQAAIKLDSDRASAYCLLAQVLERQGDRQGAIAEWETCLRYARPQNPDEDRWIGMARQVLESVEPDIDKEISTMVEVKICEDENGKIVCTQ